jgi:hypothetical protein
MEFGLYGPDKDSLVCAEEGFYRTGNLDVVAERFNIPIYHDLDEMIEDLQRVLDQHQLGPKVL